MHPLSSFHRNKSKADGLQSYCKECNNAVAIRWHAVYTEASVAKRLRSDRGYSREAAAILAKRILDPYQRCEICGIPVRILERMIGRNMPTPDHTKCGRLTVDHIIPGGPSVLGNTRILCYACNHHRGATLTDHEVWDWIVNQWQRYYTDTQLWWLCTDGPGKGGRPYRGKRHAPEVIEQGAVDAAY